MSKYSNTARYPLKLSRFSSHSKVRNIIYSKLSLQGKLNILDVGCAKGNLFHMLPKENINYTGIEPFKEDYLDAKNYGIRVIHANAEDGIAKVEKNFDVVVFADVLEHLTNPEKILLQTKSILTKTGHVIISVPNIAHFSTRLLLLFGRWNYTDRGILDRTHLKFFTRRSLIQLMENYGYEIVRWEYTPIPIESLSVGIPQKLFGLVDFINYSITKLYPKIFAFQLIVLVKPQKNFNI